MWHKYTAVDYSRVRRIPQFDEMAATRRMRSTMNAPKSLSPQFSRRLIAASGGNTKFRAALGIEHEPGSKTRVDNWRRRGIPPLAQFQYGPQLKRLATNAKRRGLVL